MNIVTIDGIPVYQALVDGEDTGMLRISLVDDPAVQSDFQAFNRDARLQLYAVQSEEKRLVRGCIMRADFPIYRRDKKNGEYYIIYKADTIRTMAEKYLAENRQNLVNLMHEEGTEQEGIQMVQYFLKGDGVQVEGFDGIADGSLFAEFHVTNDEVWDAIKAGTYKGFSLEGIFDLVPERDKASVEEIVDELDGIFARIFKNSKQYNNMKKKGLLARLAEALAAELEMGNVTTDRGVIAWDGDEDLKAGDSVYVEDENGERTAAPDGEYTTADGKVIVVVDGKVAELRDPQAEVAPEEGAAEEKVDASSVATDKGTLEWDGDEDLKAGEAVFVRDEEGNRVAAPDGEYVTEDGKTIVVVDGTVSEIRDGEAEVAPEVDARREERMALVQKFEESYDEKYRRIAEAVAALGLKDFYVIEAGDDFAVVDTWDEEYRDKYTRYSVSWNEDGSANVADPIEVKRIWVPLDFVSPFEGESEAVKALRSECETLRAQVAELSKVPAAKPAEEVYDGVPEVTGDKGLDKLAALVRRK